MTKTQKELAGAVARLNHSLTKVGKQIVVGHRNGYTALDLYATNGAMIDNFDAGLTDKQALQTVYNMAKTAEFFTNFQK